MNIFLFSGGVESTAMLPLVKKKDLVVTIRDDTFRYYKNSYSKNLQEILDYYGLVGFTIDYTMKALVQSKAPDAPYARQMSSMIPAIMALIDRLESTERIIVRDIYHGKNLNEWHDASVCEFHENPHPQYLRWEAIFNAFYPYKKIISPFVHKTKKEQYESIPEAIRQYVTTCGVKCGVCKKCLEFKKWVTEAER